MATTILPVPTVSGGITQRPPVIATPGRWKDLENWVPLSETGLIKRPGTTHRGAILTDPIPDIGLLPVDLGGDEKYVVAVGHERVKVFSRNGKEIPIYEVTRSGGFMASGTEADASSFAYLDLHTPNDVPNPDSLQGWDVDALPGATQGSAVVLDNGPLVPYGIFDATVDRYSKLTLGASSGTASYSDEFNGNIFTGLSKFSVHVNTDDSAFDLADQITLSIGDPVNSNRYQVTFDWNGDGTAEPTVDTNSDNLAYTIEQLGTNDWRLGIILDSDKITIPGVFSDTTEVGIILGEGPSATSGIYAWGALFERGGSRTEVGPYFQPPETIKTVSALETTFFANPLIATRVDSSAKASTFAEVYSEQVTFAGPEGAKDIADSGFIFVRQASVNVDYWVTLKVTNGSSTLEIEVTTVAAASDGTMDIASALATAINGDASNQDANGHAVVEADVAYSDGSVIRLRTKDDTGDTGVWTITEITVRDGLGDAGMTAFHNEIDSLSDLPVVCHHDTRVYLTEPTDADFEDVAAPRVILRFVAEGGADTFGKGYWKEGVDYGAYISVDESTLPHVLVRRVDTVNGLVTGKGSQTFFEWAPLDGTIPELDWADRETGDDTTNPFPSFVTPINSDGSQTDISDRGVDAIGFYKNRLVMVSGVNAIFSETGVYDNFFRTTVQTLIESDRIDVSSASPLSSPLFGMVESNGALFLQSRKAIFSVQATSGVLGPRTIGLDVAFIGGSGEVSQPQAALNGIFFAEGGDVFDRIRFLSAVDGEGYGDIDVSEEVPYLLQADVTSLAWSPLYRCLFVHSRENPDEVMVMRLTAVRNQTAPPAWSRWTFAGANVESVCVLGEDLFLAVDRGDGIYLESVALDVFPKDTGQDWAVRLDRRITEKHIESTPSFGGGNTTFTLPYDIESGEESNIRVAYRSGSAFGTALTVVSTNTATPGSHTVTVSGDHRTSELFFGFVTTARAKPLIPVVTQRSSAGPVPIASANIVVKQLTVRLHQSAYLVVATTDPGGSEVAESLLDNETASAVTLEDVSFRVAVVSTPEDTIVEIRNDDHKPTTVEGMEWVLEVIDRGVRVRF